MNIIIEWYPEPTPCPPRQVFRFTLPDYGTEVRILRSELDTLSNGGLRRAVFDSFRIVMATDHQLSVSDVINIEKDGTETSVWFTARVDVRALFAAVIKAADSPTLLVGRSGLRRITFDTEWNRRRVPSPLTTMDMVRSTRLNQGAWCAARSPSRSCPSAGRCRPPAGPRSSVTSAASTRCGAWARGRSASASWATAAASSCAATTTASTPDTMKDLVIAALVIAGFVITAAAVLLGYLLWLVADYNHGIKKDIEDQSL